MKGLSFCPEGIILSQSIMPQLDKFTYFTQFFWSCLFLFSLSKALKLKWFLNLEVRVFSIVITCPKLQRLLSVVKIAIYIYMMFNSGMIVYYNIIHDFSTILCVSPLEPNALPIPYDPSATGEGTSAGGPRPLEIAPEAEIDQDDLWQILAAEEETAREDARIYRAVDAINTSCQSEEGRIVAKAQTILQKKGNVLSEDDKEDVARAVNMALYDAWETDIDTRLEQFRRIRRYLGTKDCSIWKHFMDSLLSLGNTRIK